MRKPPSLITTFLRSTLMIALAACVLVGYFWISSEYARFHEQTDKLRQDYLARQQALLQENVDKAVMYIQFQRSKIEERLKQTIESRTNEAHAIAMNIYRENRADKSMSELQKMVKDALKPIRFNNGRGYYFAADMGGRQVLNALQPELEGELLLDRQDNRGRFVMRDMIALAREHRQGFILYHWTKPGMTGRDFPKIAFIRAFEPFAWFMGTCGYLDDIEQDIQAEVIKDLSRMRMPQGTFLFCADYDGGSIFSEGQVARAGLSQAGKVNAQGRDVFQGQLKAALNPEGGFVTSSAAPSKGQGAVRRITYVRAVPEWRWVVGGSFSLEPIEGIIAEHRAELEQKVRVHIIKIMAILAGMVVIIYAIALFIAYYTHIGLDSFASFFERASSGTDNVPEAGMYFSEFQRIAASANSMLGASRRANEDLKRSESRFRALIERGQEIITVFDADGVILYVTPSIQSALGYTPRQMIGRQAFDFLAPDERDRMQKLLDEIMPAQGDSRSAKVCCRHADGSVRVLECSATNHLDDPAIKAVVINGRDITARLHAEEQLKLVQFSIEQSDDAIYWINASARFMYVNEGCCKMWEYSREELLAMRISTISISAYPELWPQHWEEARTRTTFSLEGLHLTKGGKFIPVEIMINYREFGGQSYIFVIARDISERRGLEERLQRAQKMESLGLLAGGVAHDLNNILSGIMSYPDLMLMNIPAENPFAKPLEAIRRSGEKAAAIVQDLLTLARRGVSATEVVNLNQIIEDYLITPEHARLMDFHPRVRVETNLDQDLLPLMGSEVHLSKTIMNLTSNAAEAIMGDGTITISTQNQYLDRPLKAYEDLRPGDYVVLRVADTGKGISRDDLQRIFEPFYTKKVMGRSGTGLGLAVVWGTVKDHEGYIDIETDHGKGTCFSLYFPATREALPERKTTSSRPDFQGRGESVLVVDDVLEQRELATHMLLKLGYVVMAVASGEEAVAYLETRHVDLVLLDMIMDPGIDGLETYTRILKRHPCQKAVIVSGYAETDRVKQAQQQGAGPYVKKPYLIDKLGLAIRAELDREDIPCG